VYLEVYLVVHVCLYRKWKLDPDDRHDVNQADIAPLMAAFVGIPIPVNSVGTLPHQLLSVSLEDRAKLLLMNAQQISEQFVIKMESTKKRAFIFSPFPRLAASDVIDMTRKSADFIVSNQYDEAISLCTELIELSLSGLRYYHTYHRALLSISVTASYIGWIFVSLGLVLGQVSFIKSQALKNARAQNERHSMVLVCLFALCGLTVCAVLSASEVPFSYYLYCLLPLLIWYYLSTQRRVFTASYALLKTDSRVGRQLAGCLVTGVVGTWALVFSFFYRYILSLELLVFSVLFLYCSSSPVRSYAAAVSLLLSVFPALPVVGRVPNPFLVLAAGGAGTAICLLSSKSLRHRGLIVMSLLPFIAGFVSSATMFSSASYGKIPYIIHPVSWTVLLSSWVLPLLVTTKIWHRFLSIFACHAATYILISLSYDALFCVCLCVLLALWIKLEFDATESETGTQKARLKTFDLAQHHLSLGKGSLSRMMWSSRCHLQKRFLFRYRVIPRTVRAHSAPLLHAGLFPGSGVLWRRKRCQREQLRQSHCSSISRHVRSGCDGSFARV